MFTTDRKEWRSSKLPPINISRYERARECYRLALQFGSAGNGTREIEQYDNTMALLKRIPVEETHPAVFRLLSHCHSNKSIHYNKQGLVNRTLEEYELSLKALKRIPKIKRRDDDHRMHAFLCLNISNMRYLLGKPSFKQIKNAIAVLKRIDKKRRTLKDLKMLSSWYEKAAIAARQLKEPQKASHYLEKAAQYRDQMSAACEEPMVLPFFKENKPAASENAVILFDGKPRTHSQN